MLVKVTDIKGDTVWVNPLYVRCIAIKKRVTELRGSFGGSFTAGVIKTRESADELAARLSVAMPDSPAWAAAATSSLIDEESQRAAAAAAAG